MFLIVVEIAERFVIENHAIFGDEHLATGKRLLFQTVFHDRGDHVQTFGTCLHFFRLVITETCLFGKHTRPSRVEGRDGNRQLPFDRNTAEDGLRGIFLSKRCALVGHYDRFGFQDGRFICFTKIGQGEKGIDQFLLCRQLAQSRAFRNADRMHAANDHIVFLQFLIYTLHLGCRRIPADAETGDRVVAPQHLLELVPYPVTDRQGGDLFLIELLQRDDVALVLQQGDRFFIQLGGQPCGMGRVQAFGQSLRLDRAIVVQPCDVFILQDLDDLRFYLFPVQNTLF